MSDAEIYARLELESLRDVLGRHGLPMAADVDGVLRGRESDVIGFLTSPRLWGIEGSVIARVGAVQSWQVQREVEEAFLALGEWQIAHGYGSPDVRGWSEFLRRRRGPPAPVRGSVDWPGVVKEAAPVPWSVRDVWLGVLAAAVMLGVAYGLLYWFRDLAQRAELDLWTGIVSTVIELLFLVPVWWFVVHKHRASPKTLGFVGFRPSALAIGVALLFGVYRFNGFYARLLDYFDLQTRADMPPLLERLASPWSLIVVVVVVAPVAEEIFFRGFIFAGLCKRYDWRWAAAISSAVFAAAHMELTFFIPAFLMGCVFAFLYRYSRSIWPGMIVHMLTNALAMTVAYLQI